MNLCKLGTKPYHLIIGRCMRGEDNFCPHSVPLHFQRRRRVEDSAQLHKSICFLYFSVECKYTYSASPAAALEHSNTTSPFHQKHFLFKNPKHKNAASQKTISILLLSSLAQLLNSILKQRQTSIPLLLLKRPQINRVKKFYVMKR